jgi:two-component system sensor histidine kinase HydH
MDAHPTREDRMNEPKIFRPAAITPVSTNSDSKHPDVLNLAALRPAKPGWVDVCQVVDEVCAACERQITVAQIETLIDMPRPSHLWADREMLRTAISHMVANAIEAMPTGGRLVVTSYEGRGLYELEVADSGPGLSEEGLRRAFEPFYSTKRTAAGMGLAAVQRIAKAHAGNVTAANCPEGGAAFTLRLPSRYRAAAA